MNNDPFTPGNTGSSEANTNQPTQPATPQPQPGVDPLQPFAANPVAPGAAPFANPVTGMAASPTVGQAAMGQPVANGAGAGATPDHDPGKTLGIVGIILAFFITLAGLILSIISLKKSKNAGFKGTLGLVGIIVNAVIMFLSLGAFFLAILIAIPAMQKTQRELNDRASSSLTQPKSDTSTNNSALDSPSGSAPVQNSTADSAAEAKRLNGMGTVADATLQQDILRYISLTPGTGSVTTKNVTGIRSTQVDANTFNEEWEIYNPTSKTSKTFSVNLVAAANGGVSLSVSEKK